MCTWIYSISVMERTFSQCFYIFCIIVCPLFSSFLRGNWMLCLCMMVFLLNNVFFLFLAKLLNAKLASVQVCTMNNRLSRIYIYILFGLCWTGDLSKMFPASLILTARDLAPALLQPWTGWSRYRKWMDVGLDKDQGSY